MLTLLVLFNLWSKKFLSAQNSQKLMEKEKKIGKLSDYYWDVKRPVMDFNFQSYR